ncbi:MAG: GxxExxY protein [Planctomycetota bacterium]
MNHRGTETQRDGLTQRVIGCGIEVHRELGPGLLESAYEACLCDELGRAGLRFESQKSLPLNYKGRQLDVGYRVDLIVERSLIVELKTVERIEPVHEAQLLTYLKLTDIRRGLLLNFKTAVLRDGIKRMVL